MDPELRKVVRREVAETWRTVRVAAAIAFLCYAVLELIKLAVVG